MAYDPAEWTEIVTVESVTEEVMQLARDIESGWYSDATRIDWEDFGREQTLYQEKQL